MEWVRKQQGGLVNSFVGDVHGYSFLNSLVRAALLIQQQETALPALSVAL
jgi:hypothetical protein